MVRYFLFFLLGFSFSSLEASVFDRYFYPLEEKVPGFFQISITRGSDFPPKTYSFTNLFVILNKETSQETNSEGQNISVEMWNTFNNQTIHIQYETPDPSIGGRGELKIGERSISFSCNDPTIPTYESMEDLHRALARYIPITGDFFCASKDKKYQIRFYGNVEDSFVMRKINMSKEERASLRHKLWETWGHVESPPYHNQISEFDGNVFYDNRDIDKNLQRDKERWEEEERAKMNSLERLLDFFGLF